MFSFLILLNCLLFQQDALDQNALERAAQLRESALAGSAAYEIVESLTVEVGPRMAGSAGDARAVAWAQAKLSELGFDRVWTEPVEFPVWVRGDQACEILAPYPHELRATALGFSVATPAEGLQSEIVAFATLDDLKDADAGMVKGKIALITNRMHRSQNGSGYGESVGARAFGAAEAAKKGAVALLIRSIGTDNNRLPHTGLQIYADGVPKIPAAAVSNPDADLLEAMLKRGEPVVVRLFLSCHSGGAGTSYNVIGEMRGKERPDEIVLLGAHLDSWDLGTGAIDDGAGVAIMIAAARLIGQREARPRRTIRVVLFANEEQGIWGGKAYARAHQGEMDLHIIGAESDFGADRIYSLTTRVSDEALPEMRRIAEVLAPLGIEMGSDEASGGADVGPSRKLGMPVVSLLQDGTDYFDYHHTANDTLDKIDPSDLDQNVAAMAVFAYLAAETPIQFRDRDQATGVAETQ